MRLISIAAIGTTRARVTGYLIGAVAVIGLAMPLHAQGVAQSGNIAWSTESRKVAENQVAARLEAIRASAKLPPLKRVAPSVAERELVCTAAVTGRTVHDPVFGNLGTYVTRDLLAETEPLKVVALGTSACRTPQPCAESDARYKVYSDKDSGRYSVIVERNPNSTPDQPVYTVGVARRASALKEFFAQITFDNPIKDSNEGKKQVAPECRNLAY